MKCVNRMIFLAVFFFLSGCKQEGVTADYLLLHPESLKSAAIECNNQTSDNCKIVSEAFAIHTALLESMQDDPEKFGEKILKMESYLATTCMEKNEARDCLETRQQLAYMFAVINLYAPN